MKKTDKLFELSNVDAALIISEKNRLYFTGFASTFGYLVLLRKKNIFITDPRYYEMAQCLEEDGVEVVQIANGISATDMLKSIFKKHKVKTVGYEDTELTVAEYLQLKEQLGAIELAPIGNSINYVRSFKTETEIEYIRKAQSITDIAFSKILDVIKPGITERDIAVELEYIIDRKSVV